VQLGGIWRRPYEDFGGAERCVEQLVLAFLGAQARKQLAEVARRR
jgi:hypothetical protein